MDNARLELLELAAKLDALAGELIAATGRVCILRDQLRTSAGITPPGANTEEPRQGDTYGTLQTFHG